jgi:hypothetical protein
MEMFISKAKLKEPGEKRASVPLHPPQTSHKVTRDGPPLPKTVFKILLRNTCQFFFITNWVSSTSWKCFPFHTLLRFGNIQKSAGAKSGVRRMIVGRNVVSCRKLVLKARNILACYAEESATG